MATTDQPSNTSGTTPASQGIGHYRHRWEMPMVAVGIAASVLAIVAAILFAVNRSSAPGWVQAMEVTALVSPIIIAVFIRYNYRKEVVNAVEVSEQQYPELHAVFREHPQATHRLASALTQRAAPVCGDRWRPGDHPG